MDIEKYISQIDPEQIYKTIMDLEGPKHPLYNFEELEKAALYIEDKMKSYGLKTDLQEFYLEGFDKPFKNVLGYIGDPTKPAIVLGSHYDTVIDCPGANDNLSAVAISLEIARVLNKLPDPPTIIIAVFTLEEGHPTRIKRLYDRLIQDGYIDELRRPISLETRKMDKTLTKLVLKEYKKERRPIHKVYEQVLKDQKEIFSEREYKYMETLYNLEKENSGLMNLDKYPFLGLVGSVKFVEKVIKEDIKIDYVINFDTLGWISNDKGTQKPLPVTDEMKPLYTCYKMDVNDTIGNFVSVVASRNSKPMLDSFLEQCKNPKLEIPHFGLYMPFDYQTILQRVPDTLRSDHAPFWIEDIPGIFITDGGNFRSPYYHTAEDKIRHIDFDMLYKLAVATVNVILQNH